MVRLGKEAEVRPTIITIPVKSLDSILQVAESVRGLKQGKAQPDLPFRKSTERMGDWRGGRLVKNSYGGPCKRQNI